MCHLRIKKEVNVGVERGKGRRHSMYESPSGKIEGREAYLGFGISGKFERGVLVSGFFGREEGRGEGE